MKRMGGDPEISAQCQSIVREFAETEGGGLANGTKFPKPLFASAWG